MIFVLAGVNGAGKSSIGGESLRAVGAVWYNPDEFARALQGQFPDRPLDEINSAVWTEGVRRLRRAIAGNTNFILETTLGGSTITNTLLDAIAVGVPVRIWYCGLASLEQHIERVTARVTRGGHDIPEALIRARYKQSMRNLCRLTPRLHELVVDDNSAPLDESGRPQIRRLLHVIDGQLIEMNLNMPDWAKPVAAVVLHPTMAR